MAFVLLGLTLRAVSAHACRIERTDPTTLTIRGQCSQSVLFAQLSLAVRQMETRGEISVGSSSTGSSEARSDNAGSAAHSAAPSPSKKVDLVSGYLKSNKATFFHRANTK